MSDGDSQRGLLHELLPAAVDKTRLGICITTFDATTSSYRIVYANQAVADIFGTTLADVLARDPFTRIVPTETSTMMAFAAAAICSAVVP